MFEAGVFEEKLKEILNIKRPLAKSTLKRRYRTHIGVSFEVCAEVWRRMVVQLLLPDKAKPHHLLWALMFLNMYNTVDAYATLVDKDPSTWRKWIWAMVHAIEALETTVIVFDNRFQDRQPGDQCLISVDCTDCFITEEFPFCALFWSHKFNHAAYKYEIAVCIRTGYIVWVNGPWPASVADKQIYETYLAKKLEKDEKVAADSGYSGCTNVVQPEVAKTWIQKKQKSQANGRHETVNGRFKQFNALSNRFYHQCPIKHRSVFVSVVVLTQIDFELNGTTFPVQIDGDFK